MGFCVELLQHPIFLICHGDPKHTEEMFPMDEEQTRVYGLRAQVAAYFEHQAEHLLSESRAAASLTTHPGLYGIAGEEAVRSFLRKHLPRKYGIGTGHVVSYEANSAQVDAVVFDTQECFTVPITETSTLFSIEGVYAVIAIKSSPCKSSSVNAVIKDAVTNIASVHKIVTPFPFSFISKIPPYTSFADPVLLNKEGAFYVKLKYPVSAVLLLGAGARFRTIVKDFREAQGTIEHWHDRPDMLCVIDEKEYGLCGFEYATDTNQIAPRFWRETCDSPGQTLATFLYWLAHKMSFERIVERPLVYNQDVQAIWPSAIAPVVRRIKVDVDEEGTQRSWPWRNDTRVFE